MIRSNQKIKFLKNLKSLSISNMFFFYYIVTLFDDIWTNKSLISQQEELNAFVC